MTDFLPRVILVEDDEPLRVATEQALVLAGHAVTAFGNAAKAIGAIDPSFDGVVVSDIRMPQIDGHELLARVRSIDAEIPVILVTGHGDVSMAVKALHDGASDFLTKPFATGHLIASIRRALERRTLVLDNRRLRLTMAQLEAGDALIGDSPAMTTLRQSVRQIAVTDLDVLFEGETGTGKELVARLLHFESRRRGRPFVAVNCGALAEATAEAELFGHAADSVPQTRLSRVGQIAASNGGTLLLDEIDSMPLALQATLLRVIEEREVHPIGAARPVALDLRIVATAKSDLHEEARAGRFREDLYYRLATVRLRVPPLRERDDDCHALFAMFLAEARATLSKPDFEPDMAAHLRLRQHQWPGNVRELRSYAYEIVIGASAREPAAPALEKATLPQQVATFEADLIARTLARHGGKVKAAVDELRIPRKTFYDKLARYNIVPSRYRSR
ncbi:MAG: Fis family transcriptional regulator [Sphingomonas bacterium]|uniref:sigma-54-dependent transcriptional regulator n=1 Tax=Sphingomonas bacterium TaxID=1895847 RepID=UPI002612FD9B|nr:sigma-54 dependent transcriptional regulator [Sphingomonas bacterium]MDB5696441.1 Fis family transcriptional regulator [Sphingomonas bacterium]